MRVAFLGLGRGDLSASAALFRAGFATLFRAGHQLVTWHSVGSGHGDGSGHGAGAGACPELADFVVRLPTLVDVLDGADVVISHGPDDRALHDLVMRQGLLDFMAGETVHVSLTRASVPAVRDVTEMHEAKQQRFVSAPLIRQEPGSVSIAAAGHDESVRRVQPLLEAIGQCVVVGPAPWVANLVSLGIGKLADDGPDSVDEVHAMIGAAGIPLELFRQAVRDSLPANPGIAPVVPETVSMPPDRAVLRSAADFANHA